MACTVDARERAKRAAGELEDLRAVVAVDILAPTTAPRRCWSLEITTTTPPADGVLATLTEHGLALPTVAPQGPEHYLAAATT